MRVIKFRVFVLVLAVGFLPIAMGERSAHAGLANPLTDATGYDDSFTHWYELSKIGSPSVTSIVGTGTLIEVGDDANVDIPIGFDFNFFSTYFNDLQLNGNGQVYLGTGYDPEGIYIGPTSNGAHPEDNGGSMRKNYAGPRIAFWNDDLRSATGVPPDVIGIGDVYYETRGAAPNREFVVELDAVHSYEDEFDPGGYATSVQMILQEETNDIIFNYTAFAVGTAEKGLAIGIQADSYSYLQYGYFEADDKELPLTVGVPSPGDSLLWHPTSLAPPKILEAFVDRVTGEVRLENNSGAPLDIKGYSITSPDGSLNPASAAFLSDSDPNWIRLSSATGNDLSEAHLTTGTIADGASLVFGNGTWLQYYKEDVELKFLDSEGRLIVGPVVFSGDAGAGDVPFAAVDLNFDTLIDIQDWLTFKSNVGNDLSDLSVVELYRNSDLNGDGVHGVEDFTIFKQGYDAANGVGAFNAIVGVVPEPSTLALMGLGGAIALGRRRRRRNTGKDSMNNLNNRDDGGDESTRKGARNCKGWLLVMSIVAILAAPAHGQDPDDTWVHSEEYTTNGHTYILLDLTRDPLVPRENSFANLEAAAVDIGGHLVTINDEDEDTWINGTFYSYLLTTGNDSIVTGFTDFAEEGTWLWTSGEEDPWIRDNDPWWWEFLGNPPPAPGNTTYSNWREAEPNGGRSENNMRKEYGSGPGHPHFGIWQDYFSEIPGQNATHPGLVEVIEFLPPIELGLTVDKASGALTLGTTAAETIFNSYNITSAEGALDPAGWNAGNLASQATGGLSADSDGDGDVDGADFLAEQRAGLTPTYLADFQTQFGQIAGSPGNQWEVLNDTTKQLFEAYLSGDETIAPHSSISIGNGYNTANGAEDLKLTFSLPNGKTLTGTVSYINASTAAGVAVPEPSTMALVMFAALFGIVTRWRENIQELLGVRTMKVFCKLPTATISALLGLAWLASAAQANFFLERDYRLGDDGAENAVAGAVVSSGGTYDSNAPYTDLSRVTNSPVYTTITGRPDGGSGLGIAFDGSMEQYVRGRRLGNPGTSVESTYTAGGEIDYFGTEFRGMQFWTKPGSASGAQVIVMDTNQHGVRISADGYYSMRYAGRDYDTNIPATAGVWRHIMVVVPDNGGALMYIDGLGESAAPGLYAISDMANLVLGANTHGGEFLASFDGGFKEFYTGTIDDLEMFVLGKNQLGTIDFGTFDFTTDNDYVVSLGFIPANPLDINGNGVVFGDGTGLAAVDDVTAFVEGWLHANRHYGVVFPDLSTVVNGDINFDGITDLGDWSLLNAANPAMGAAILQSLAAAVPEPSSCLLMAVAGLLGLPALRRKARRS